MPDGSRWLDGLVSWVDVWAQHLSSPPRHSFELHAVTMWSGSRWPPNTCWAIQQVSLGSVKSYHRGVVLFPAVAILSSSSISITEMLTRRRARIYPKKCAAEYCYSIYRQVNESWASIISWLSCLYRTHLELGLIFLCCFLCDVDNTNVRRIELSSNISQTIYFETKARFNFLESKGLKSVLCIVICDIFAITVNILISIPDRFAILKLSETIFLPECPLFTGCNTFICSTACFPVFRY